MGASALYVLAACCCAAAAAMRGSYAAGATEVARRHGLALVGGCGQAARCMAGRNAQLARFVSRAGRSDDPVEEYCGVAAARADCLGQCPNEPPEHSLVKMGNTIDAFVCHEKKQEFKEAAACFAGSRRLTLEHGACTPCRRLVGDWRWRWSMDMLPGYHAGGNLTVADYVGLLNADTGLVGQLCSTVRCALGCLESVSEEHCGDKRHGELVRELVRLAQSEVGDVVQHLGLGCIVPDACKPSAN